MGDPSTPANGSVALAFDVVEEGHSLRLEEDSPLALTNPVHEVLFNEDILPEIIFQFKSLFEGENGWKQPVSRLLVVSKAVFYAGLCILWQSMDSLKPAFKLLPWFTKPKYEGLGVHKYSGVDDWHRFNLYSSCIRRFTFESSRFEMAAPYIVELLTLPGRPEPLFPKLQDVAILPMGSVSVPSLFFLITPSMRTFERLAVTPLDPPDGRDMGLDSSSPPEDLMAAIPRMTVSSFHLHSFSYSGPTNEEFMARLCQLTTLKTLRLTITNRGNPDTLQYIHCLPTIERLNIEGVWLAGDVGGRRIVDLPPERKRMPKLRVLDILATSFGQLRVAYSLGPSPYIRRLRLRFFAATDLTKMKCCIQAYLMCNPAIDEFAVEFYGSRNGPVPNVSISQHRFAARGFPQSLQHLRKIRGISFIDIPYSLASASTLSILGAIGYWATITRVTFRILHSESAETPTATSSSPFPGLSFLSSTVWRSCPNLQELEFHFNRNLVVEEDLAQSLDACRSTVHHPLRELRINTGANRAESEELDLPLPRKVDIAMMLDHLFPRLDILSGSAGAQWDEVGVLVKAFQKQRGFVFREVEGLFDRP